MKIIMLISLAGVAGMLARYSMVKRMSALPPNFLYEKVNTVLHSRMHQNRWI